MRVPRRRAGAARATGALLALLTTACAPDVADDPATPPDSTGGLAQRLSAPVPSGAAHPVRLVTRPGEARFDPPEVTVRPGDVVRFVHTAYQPQSIQFDTRSITPRARAWLRGRQLVAGPLLTSPGQIYEVSFRDAPPGRYPFFSPAAPDSRGAVVVVDPVHDPSGP